LIDKLVIMDLCLLKDPFSKRWHQSGREMCIKFWSVLPMILVGLIQLPLWQGVHLIFCILQLFHFMNNCQI